MKPRKKCDLLVFGETTRDTIATVDNLPLPAGAAARVSNIRGPSLGGRAVNVATYAKLFGADAHVLSACDHSYVSEYEKLALTAHADMQSMFRFNEGKDNAQALIFRDAGRQVTFFYPGTAIVTGEDGNAIDAESTYKKHVRDIIQHEYSPKLLYCTSELHALVDEIMGYYSKTNSVTRIYSPGPEVQRISREKLARILECTNILFLSYFEMQQIQKAMGASLSEIMRSYNVDVAVATLGHVGSLLLHRTRKSNTPTTQWLPVVREKLPVVDTTGAGDALAGGFLGYLITKSKTSKPKLEDYMEALKYGMVLSSFVIEHYGTLVAQLSLSEVHARFHEYEARLN